MRILWLIGGWTSFGLGFAGAFLPLVPTVPFMLLAAFCFARSSVRFHDWLMAHPQFGQPIADWRRHGAIGRRAKGLAMLAVLASLGVSLLIGVPGKALAIQAAALACVAVFILTRPDGPRGGPGAGTGDGTGGG